MDRETGELDPVVGHDPSGAVRRGLGEVVQHSRLVDDQVRELADVVGVVGRAGGADDLVALVGVRPPEVHPADVVGLGDDPLGEPERLERLDTARLDAIGLAEREAAVALLDDARGDAGVLRHLGREEHSRRPRSDDEHVDLVGKVGGARGADTGGVLHARVSGDVAVVVELHRRRFLPDFFVGCCLSGLAS